MLNLQPIGNTRCLKNKHSHIPFLERYTTGCGRLSEKFWALHAAPCRMCSSVFRRGAFFMIKPFRALPHSIREQTPMLQRHQVVLISVCAVLGVVVVAINPDSSAC